MKKFSLIISLILNVILLAFIGYYSYKENYIQRAIIKASVTAGTMSPLEALTNNSVYASKVTSYQVLPNDPGGIIFLGDSLTNNGNWSELFPHNQVKNRGIGGDKTYGVLNRLDDVIAAKPDKIFLMIGTNDILSGRSSSDVINDYDKIVSKILNTSPSTKIFLQSVLLINNQKSSFAKDSNVKIETVNKEIKSLADKYSLTYIDVSSILSQNGQLKTELTPDGIHLNINGYLIWRDVLKPYI